MGANNSKPDDKEVYYNKLPGLVDDWDESRAQQVKQFQDSLVSRSAAFPKSERERYASMTDRDTKDRDAKNTQNKNGITISNYMSENFAEEQESADYEIKHAPNANWIGKGFMQEGDE